MELRILQVPGCPNAAILAARLAELADADPGLHVVREVVTTQKDAERLGMTGSPTLLPASVAPHTDRSRSFVSARRGQAPRFTSAGRGGACASAVAQLVTLGQLK